MSLPRKSKGLKSQSGAQTDWPRAARRKMSMFRFLQRLDQKWASPWRCWPFWVIVGVALAVRLFLILNSTYIWDEDREWIILARSISFSPDSLSLPLQGDTHPVLPAYMMHLGSLLWGENPLGFRFFSLVAGCLTVIAGARMSWHVAGAAAGLATATLLALNEYHMVISSVAVDMVFYLLFSLLALSAFTSFLRKPGSATLLATGLFCGLGYMCNERTALLLPVFGVFMLTRNYRRWLVRWPAWMALLLFLAVISPDLLKLGADESDLKQVTHSDHLERFAGLGITYQPAAFFGKTAVATVLAATGREFRDWAPEYPAMNEISGLAIFMGILLVVLARDRRGDPAVRLWLSLFLFTFLFLVVLNTEYNPERDVGPQAWYWADLTLLPAALLTGMAVSRLAAWPGRAVAILLLAGGLASLTHLSVDQFRFQRMKIGVQPGVLWPVDNRNAEVGVAVLSCVACDPHPEALLEKVMVQTGDGWREAAPGEYQRATPGADGSLLLRASPTIKAYGLHYLLSESSGREMRTSILVLVRPQAPRGKRPFWVADKVAQQQSQP